MAVLSFNGKWTKCRSVSIEVGLFQNITSLSLCVLRLYEYCIIVRTC